MELLDPLQSEQGGESLVPGRHSLEYGGVGLAFAAGTALLCTYRSRPHLLEIGGQYVGDRLPGREIRFANFGVQRHIHAPVPDRLLAEKGLYSNIALRTYSSSINREEAFITLRLADLYLMKAEAWNEYEGPLADDSHVYEPLNKVRERAGIPDVQTSWTNYSNQPDKVKTQEGMREIIRQEWNIEFAFEGRRFWNLRRWLTAADELNEPLYGWNIVGKDAQAFYNNYNGPIVAWSKRAFVAPRDYLFPLRSEEILMSGCRQNPGW